MNGFAALDIHPHRRYVVDIGGRRSSRCRLHINFALFLHSLDFTQNLGVTLIRSRNAAETRQAIVYLLNELPCLSISLDNGSEFSEFQLLEKDLQTTVYFAEPHKPWQRGTNENTNDILRFFYPKGYDFRTLSQKELQKVVDLINSRPRKCLGWKSPAEIFFDSSVALT